MLDTEVVTAAEVNVGDLVRLPEGKSLYQLTDVRFVMSDEGAFHVVLDAGFGTCELPWRTLVDRWEA